MGSSFHLTTQEKKKSAESGTDSALRLDVDLPHHCLAKLSMSVLCMEHKCWGACLCTMSVAWPERLRRPSCCADPSFWWEVVDRVKVSAVWVFVLKREVEGKSQCLSIISSAPSTKWTKVWLFSCYSVMIHGKHLPENALGFFGLRAKCPCKCSLCACVCVFMKHQLHECISVWQMWLIFHGSHKVHAFLLLAGCTDCFHCWSPERGNEMPCMTEKYMASVNMCTYGIHETQTLQTQQNKLTKHKSNKQSNEQISKERDRQKDTERNTRVIATVQLLPFITV